ncbi:hypothetical protein, partial [Salmonella sp. SKLX122283]|uniref:hypothetical protein n=1 Tax=Salmonella sp. SKLX122283 TaxID=3160097 RepID=UPI003755347E
VAAEASSTTDQAIKDVRFLQTVLSPLPKDDAKKVLKQLFSAWNIRVNDRVRRPRGDGTGTTEKSSRGSIDSTIEVASNHSRGSQGTTGAKDV